MKLILLGILMALIPTITNAANINCGGAVSWLMADHPSCNGHMSFKTESTGGKNGRWMCTKSKEAGSLVLTALVAQKRLEVYIAGSDVNSCNQLPHYRKVSYIIINP